MYIVFMEKYVHIQRSKRSPRIQISPAEVVDVPDYNVGCLDVPDDNVGDPYVPDNNVVGPGKVEDVQMAIVVDLMNLMFDILMYLMAMLVVLTSG